MSGYEFAPIDPQLPENETRFHLLLDTLPFIAFIIAPEGHARYYNRQFIEYHGFVSNGDKASRTLLIHPDDQDRLVSISQFNKAALCEYVIEARLRRHDGVYRWHRIHNKPLIQAGGLTSWFGSAVDIHDIVHANEHLEQRVAQRIAELETVARRLPVEIEQRQHSEEGLQASEARYRLLYNRTPMALHSVDAQAQLIDVNDTWLTLFEYTREEVIGRSPSVFMSPHSAKHYLNQAWPEMLASKGQLRVVDYQFLTRSNRVFDGRLSASGEFDAGGRFVRSWAAIADVTIEKRTDRDLRQAQRMEAVGQLTAGIAHDFNNLLTAILGNLELMSRPPPKDRPIDHARNDRLIAGARSAAQRGAKLTSQLLAFSRQQKITVEPLDLNRVIQEMTPLLHATIGSSIKTDIRPGHALFAALADSTQLELAILNLAINARDAMPHGGVITIETANVARGEPAWPEEPAAGDYVAVSVSDTGTGIPDAVREKMFEPFFTTKEVGRGSGLGLPQVLGVVKQLGGGLTVQSRPGQGTSISVFLLRAGNMAAAEVAAPAIQPNAKPQPIQQARILVVDDDADVRSTAAAMLSDAGYDVTEASSGASALNALEGANQKPDLVLADISMLGVNGVEFAVIVRRTWPTLRVLLMTGLPDSSPRWHGAEYVILQKPFGAAELEAKVAQAMATPLTDPS